MRKTIRKVKIVSSVAVVSTSLVLAMSVSMMRDNPIFTGDYFIKTLNYFKYKIEYKNISINNTYDQNYVKKAKSIPVLLYHGIIDKPDGANILLENFKDQMFALKKEGWQTISIEDFYKFVKEEKELPDKSFLLTFDDGRKDSYYPVDPILKALDYNAVMFVITKYSMEDKSGNYYLSKKELKQMIKSGRWEIEAHTREGHNIYKISSDGEEGHFYSNKLWIDNENRFETTEEFTDRIREDFISTKDDIERELGFKVISFAFPFGDYGKGSVNFSESVKIIPNLIREIYPISFYQMWPDNGFSFNYSDSSQILFKRIDVKQYWNTDNLLKLLEINTEKRLPYFDNFEKYNGWINNWGKLLFNNNSIVMISNILEKGNSIFLSGSYLWEDYVFKSNIELIKGQNFSLLARYKDGDNYVSCGFYPEFVKIERVSNKEKTLISEKKGNFIITDKKIDAGIRVIGNTIDCYINDEIVLSSYDINDIPEHGGIGFGIWDSKANNSEMIVKNVSVEEII